MFFGKGPSFNYLEGVFFKFIYFTSYLQKLALCHKQNIYFRLCVETNTYFIFLEFVFSVYKVVSQIRSSIGLKLEEPSEANLNKFKGHLIMQNEEKLEYHYIMLLISLYNSLFKNYFTVKYLFTTCPPEKNIFFTKI